MRALGWGVPGAGRRARKGPTTWRAHRANPGAGNTTAPRGLGRGRRARGGPRRARAIAPTPSGRLALPRPSYASPRASPTPDENSSRAPHQTAVGASRLQGVDHHHERRQRGADEQGHRLKGLAQEPVLPAVHLKLPVRRRLPFVHIGHAGPGHRDQVVQLFQPRLPQALVHAQSRLGVLGREKGDLGCCARGRAVPATARCPNACLGCQGQGRGSECNLSPPFPCPFPNEQTK